MFRMCTPARVLCYLVIFCSYISNEKGIFSQAKCLIPKSTKLTTICLGKQSRLLSCHKPLENGTRILFKCREPSYVNVHGPGHKQLTCRNGQWYPEFNDDFCMPACGRPYESTSGKTPMNNVESLLLPWHATIYGKYEEKWARQCSGSLITKNVVVTAAHCFKREIPGIAGFEDVNIIDMKVVLGDYSGDFEIARNNGACLMNMDSVMIPDDYEGSKSNFDNDIALVILETDVAMSPTIAPVCLDTRRDADVESVKIGRGLVGAWGSKNNSHGMRTVQVNLLERTHCLDNSALKEYVASDKLCTDSGAGDICRGDTGAGFVLFNEHTKSYFLRGVLSIGERSCGGENLFTSISKHGSFIEKHVKPSEVSFIK